MEKLKKDHFQLLTDEDGLRYLVQAKDELTKNHRKLERREHRGYIVENPTDPMCPINSYLKYMEHLNPANDYLWQTPLQKIEDESTTKVWYSRAHLGKNPLSKFMSDLSSKCHLSQLYHNHSIRATGCTVTGRRFTPKVVMNWSGHASVQSLTTYQKVSHEEKIQLAKALQESLQKPKPQPSIEPPPEAPALPPAPNPPAIEGAHNPVQLAIEPPPADENKQVVPLEPNFDDAEDFDFDLFDIIKQVEKEESKKNQVQKQANVSNAVVTNTNQPKTHMFSACKIGTINVQIHNHYK